MYAIIRTGGKQYRVSEGDTIYVERLHDAKSGDKVTLGEVLLVGGERDPAGRRPLLTGREVPGTVVEQGRGRQDPRLQVQEAQALPPNAGPPPVVHAPLQHRRASAA